MKNLSKQEFDESFKQMYMTTALGESGDEEFYDEFEGNDDYSQVDEKALGERLKLKEYLNQLYEVVSGQTK